MPSGGGMTLAHSTASNPLPVYVSMVLAAFLAIVLSSSAAVASEFDEAEVVALSRAKLGDEALIAQIESQPCKFDLSTPSLARLKKAGVSNAVIAAIIRHCAVQDREQLGKRGRSDEVMFYNPYGWLLPLPPVTVAVGHAGGNGSLLFPSRSRLTLPGEASVNVIQPGMSRLVIRPNFTSLEKQGFTAQPPSVETLTARYRLARFEIKDGKRSLMVDSVNPLGGTVGLASRDIIAFHAVPYVDATFRLEANGALPPGEYALIDISTGPSYQIYDFSVR